jgi:uncharacterized membrane protein YcjF (UPF0283 family)
MKPLFVITLLMFTLQSFSQNCIDYIILNINNDNAKTDTIFCKLLSEDDETVVIDNGYAITTLKKSLVEKVKYCAREMTPYEVYKFQGLDAVTADMFKNNNTAGAYLRKGARSTYLGAGLAIVGTGVTLMGAFWVKSDAGKTACYITGGVTAATGIFFIIRGWNQIYKAGKLLDLSAQSALYLNANQEGIGVSLKF